jgi:predicted transcriptional regulator
MYNGYSVMQKEPTHTEERIAVIARVDRDLRAELAELAARNHRSLSGEVRRALEAHVQAERAPASAQETT